MFTIAQLDQMIIAAMRLGYQDDVDRWKAERAKLKAAL